MEIKEFVQKQGTFVGCDGDGSLSWVTFAEGALSPTCQFGLRRVELGDFCIPRSIQRPGVKQLMPHFFVF